MVHIGCFLGLCSLVCKQKTAVLEVDALDSTTREPKTFTSSPLTRRAMKSMETSWAVFFSKSASKARKVAWYSSPVKCKSKGNLHSEVEATSWSFANVASVGSFEPPFEMIPSFVKPASTMKASALSLSKPFWKTMQVVGRQDRVGCRLPSNTPSTLPLSARSCSWSRVVLKRRTLLRGISAPFDFLKILPKMSSPSSDFLL